MAETGKIFNTLEFGGINSGDYGVYITGTGVYNAPARAVEMVSVPGRNGDVPIDMGHWDNIEVTYKCGLFGIDQSEMGEALMEFRNAIASQIGYQRLSDSYNPNEFRLGLFMAGLEFDAVSRNRAGEFELKFNCKPQRFLTDGEEMIDVKSDWSDLKAASGEVVTFEVADDAAANYTQFKSLVANIDPVQDLNGYDHPWVGGAGKNKLNMVDVLPNGSYNGDVFTCTSVSNPTVELFDSPQTVTLSYESGTFTGTRARLEFLNGSTVIGNKGLDSASQISQTFQNVTAIRFNYGAGGTLTLTKPQLELGSTATEWTPYENLCPISGWDSVEASVVGKNLFNKENVTDLYCDGSVKLVSNATFKSVYIPLLPNTNYVYSQSVFGNYTRLAVCDSLEAGAKIYSPTAKASGFETTTPLAFTNTNYKYLVCTIYRSTTDTHTFDEIADSCMLELGSTATEYTPYQGTTYTATFDETVYGGTVDLVSGVLTVDRAIVDLGTLNWLYSAADSRFYYNGLDYKRPPSGNVKANAICSGYPVVAFGSFADKTISLYSNGYMYAKDSNYTSTAAFITAMNGVQLVYELAEPRTIQLDPQTINTLVGANNVWANSGDVSVEYGVRPGVLINPTQYESQPLIQIDGTGRVGLNDYIIAINEETVGEITLADSISDSNVWSSNSRAKTYTFDIDFADMSQMMAEGDAFAIENIRHYEALKPSYDSYYGYATATITQAPTNGNASISPIVNGVRTVDAEWTGFDFVYGTAQSYSDSLAMRSTWGHAPTSGTQTWELTVDYDGATTITATFVTTGSAYPNQFAGSWAIPVGFTIAAVIGQSTVPIELGTIYIDSETGDAYRVEGGTYISLNKYIQLGAQLPTLRPGANIITYDDTITSLKIAPRWWRL